MRQAVKRVRGWYASRAMRTKLTLSFSVIIILLLGVLMLILYRIISTNSKQQILYSASQSYDQAYAFLDNYINIMSYVSDMVYYNGDVQRTLAANEFSLQQDYGSRYREYLILNNVMVSAGINDIVYLAKLYLPDDIIYTSNLRHFAPLSMLESREDYGDFLAAASREKVFFTAPYDLHVPGLTVPVNVVSVLRRIRSTDGASRFLAVEEISIKTQTLQEVIVKSNITENGFVYLINNRGDLISASDPQKLQELLGNIPSFSSYAEWQEIQVLGVPYFAKQQPIFNADWMLVALVPQSEIYAPIRLLNLAFVIIALVGVTLIACISYFLAGSYTMRLYRLSRLMNRVQQGKFQLTTQEQFGSDEIGGLYERFCYMTNELQNLMDQQYKIGKAAKNAELRALQAQINPHFLYNTLDLINWEALDYNAHGIAEITQNLARYYRLSLNKGRQIVTVEEELEHVKAYVKIENYHFDDGIHLHIDVPGELLGLACINLILQPFVENSILHGMRENLSAQECAISIGARREDNDLLIWVEDDGLGMSPEQMDLIFKEGPPGTLHGYGINNINSRIRLCYGESYGLRFESVKGEGTTVFIRIPALTPPQAEDTIR